MTRLSLPEAVGLLRRVRLPRSHEGFQLSPRIDRGAPLLQLPPDNCRDVGALLDLSRPVLESFNDMHRTAQGVLQMMELIGGAGVADIEVTSAMQRSMTRLRETLTRMEPTLTRLVPSMDTTDMLNEAQRRALLVAVRQGVSEMLPRFREMRPLLEDFMGAEALNRHFTNAERFLQASTHCVPLGSFFSPRM